MLLIFCQTMVHFLIYTVSPHFSVTKQPASYTAIISYERLIQTIFDGAVKITGVIAVH